MKKSSGKLIAGSIYHFLQFSVAEIFSKAIIFHCFFSYTQYFYA